jgi:hypothetical protein
MSWAYSEALHSGQFTVWHKHLMFSTDFRSLGSTTIVKIGARSPRYSNLQNLADNTIPERQMTVSDTRAGVISASIVVLLALATPAAYIIVNRSIVRTWTWLEKLHHHRRERRRAEEPQNPPQRVVVEITERTSLLPIDPRPSYQATIRETWKVSKSPDFALIELGRLGWEILTHGPERLADTRNLPNGSGPSTNSVGEFYTGFNWLNMKARWPEILLLVILWLFCFGTFGLFIWGSIASGNMVSDSAALADGKDCAFWIPDTSAPPKENGTYGHFYLQEVEAGEYASNCYGTPQGTDGCNIFVSQDIPYTEIENALCPFSDELCLDGRFSALTMRTPLLSSKSLGINVPIGYLFNRTTTCAPVKRDRFVKENGTKYEYFYGPIPGLGESTWSSPKQKPKTVPGYEVA